MFSETFLQCLIIHKVNIPITSPGGNYFECKTCGSNREHQPKTTPPTLSASSEAVRTTSPTAFPGTHHNNAADANFSAPSSYAGMTQYDLLQQYPDQPFSHHLGFLFMPFYGFEEWTPQNHIQPALAAADGAGGNQNAAVHQWVDLNG